MPPREVSEDRDSDHDYEIVRDTLAASHVLLKSCSTKGESCSTKNALLQQ